MAGPIHLRPTADLAERVLVPGDPGRALMLAQSLMTGPKMFNHNRGLWGYTGVALDGEPLSIQSTGMGGPSAAIVISELADLGARRILRVGTCGALDASLALGELIVAAEALGADGTSRALRADGPSGAPGAGPRFPSSPELAEALAAAAAGSQAGLVVSTDLFYDAPPGQEEGWLAEGALAVEMEAATLFALAARRGFQAGALLIVSDLVLPARKRIEAEALVEAEQRAGAVALEALGTA